MTPLLTDVGVATFRECILNVYEYVEVFTQEARIAWATLSRFHHLRGINNRHPLGVIRPLASAHPTPWPVASCPIVPSIFLRAVDGTSPPCSTVILLPWQSCRCW